MPLVLLYGPCQVEGDVPESDGLGEMVLDRCASLRNTCTGITHSFRIKNFALQMQLCKVLTNEIPLKSSGM